MCLHSTSAPEQRTAEMIRGRAKVTAGKQHRWFHMRMLVRRNFHMASFQRSWDKQYALKLARGAWQLSDSRASRMPRHYTVCLILESFVPVHIVDSISSAMNIQTCSAVVQDSSNYRALSWTLECTFWHPNLRGCAIANGIYPSKSNKLFRNRSSPAFTETCLSNSE